VRYWAYLLPLALSACVSTQAPESTAADRFFNSFSRYCGQSFSGKLAAGDASDTAFANADMRAQFEVCDATRIEIKFDVGEDRSRTWIITKTPTGLRLKHRHMLKDGTEDPVSQYGGDTVDSGSATRQQFPVDDYSKAMFTKEGRTVSNTNVWAFEIEPGASFTYELSRPNRLFRVAFDLAKPMKSPVQ
jgi:hypothetical protein